MLCFSELASAKLIWWVEQVHLPTEICPEPFLLNTTLLKFLVILVFIIAKT